MRKRFCLFISCFLVLCFTQITKGYAHTNDFSYRINDSIHSDDFDLPMHISPLLSANFGELRINHFHSGLDFKTQGAEGKNVYAVADGWISRIGVRVDGYGKAIYIDHPNGYTSVYAHLKDLSPTLDSILKDAQYASQSYEQNLLFEKNALPVNRGEKIAESGNTGSSGGPHLHFEIRQTETEEPMDPLLWYHNRIIDQKNPRLQAIAIYAAEGQGVLSSAKDKEIVPFRPEQEQDFEKQLPAVWGKIGIGLKAYNYMTGTQNIYGVCMIRLTLDNQEIFRQELNRFSFDESRYINTMVDYQEWTQNKSWIMKSFIDGINHLDIYPQLKNDGWVDINEERPYHFCYELSDRNGNVTTVSFTLRGKKMPISTEDSSKLYMQPLYENEFIRSDIQLILPQGCLYKKLAFEYDQKPPLQPQTPSAKNPRSYSDRYEIHHSYTPLHRPANVLLRIQKDILPQKEHYYLAVLLPDKQWKYVPGRYEDGCLKANISEFGTYTVLADSISPKIIFPDIANAIKNGLLRIVIRDEASGIAGYSGLVDGKWALLEDDYKRESVIYRFDARSIQENHTNHLLEIKVWDYCGNEKTEKLNFYY